LGIIIEVNRVAEKIDGIAKAAEMDFRTKKVVETEIYPHLLLFPLPIQQLLVQEYNKMEDRLSEGKQMAHVGGNSNFLSLQILSALSTSVPTHTPQ
jgi:hypothetical protein